MGRLCRGRRVRQPPAGAIRFGAAESGRRSMLAGAMRGPMSDGCRRGPAGPIGCFPRRNGNIRRVPGLRQHTPGGPSRTGTGANCKGCGSRWDGRKTARIGTFHGKRIRVVRHARQRAGVGRRLLARQLSRCADRRQRLDGRWELRQTGLARRLVAGRSGAASAAAARINGKVKARNSKTGFRVALTLVP